MTLVANYQGYTHTATLDFEATLIDTCIATTFLIDPTILSQTTITYYTGPDSHIETLDSNKVIASPDNKSICPPIVFSFTDTSTGGPVDSRIFTYSVVTNEFKV